MFFNGSLFWFLMGITFVLIAFAFKAFVEDRGWVLTWWKGLIAMIAYTIFSLSLYAWGTMAGENEAGAGFKIFLLGLFVTLIIVVGLWRLLSSKPKNA